ncbi:sensor histidine kinase KdpD [Pseudomonas sp. NBRC 111124]|nr:HAMP domain-containing sensor histidine kinase [Pseudomonas sp. NBRC 111124]HDS0927202.1 HAMP domain-containing histidine kinase [Pseudomonas putida]HEE9763556.1 HAMP domain-containing histidine kinase [Pseudomonas putida]
MVSEYRALRSSVLRLWLAQETSVEHPERVAEIIRFNEAIDQALMESIAAYGKAVETTRKLVLGVLGHDMRAPLTAITMGAGLLANAHQMGVREQKVVGQISVSVERANDMVNDLLDLARCNLSTGIPIQRQTFELRELCTSFVKEVSLAHPEATIVFEGISSLSASFDPQRMGQVISNLVINAIRHGDVKKPIQLRLTGSHGVAQIDVHNWGSPISPDELPYLFNPEARLARATDDSENTHGLGLGLFIANEIVTSHGGTIDVMSSDEDGTTFKVAFPQGS